VYDLNVLNLGAGVQSMAVILLAEKGEIERPDCAIFADTGWEPDAIYDQLNWLKKETTIPIHVVTAGNIKDDVLKSITRPGQKGVRGASLPFFVRNTDENNNAQDGILRRQCTSEYKIQPIQKKIRTLLGYQPRQRVKKKVRQWFGISLDEAHRMRDSNVGWIDNYYPLVDLEMRRADCLSWMKEQGYPEPRKSACIGCPFHSNSTWAKMRRDYPDEFDDAIAFDTQLRTGKLFGVRGDAYLHRRMLPLAEAVDSTHDPDQVEMDFGEECEGMCGV